MNVVECENGHWFDEDRDTYCPQCGAAKRASENSSADSKPEKKHFFRGKKDRKVITVEKTGDDGTIGKFVDTPSKAQLVNDDVEDKATQPSEEAKEKTPEKDPEPTPAKTPPVPEEKRPDLGDEIDKVKSKDEQTMGVFRSLKGKNDQPQAGGTVSVDFPVGWLVCIKGVNLGKTYPISAGQNTIGRNSNYTIALSGDNYVSASNIHTKLIYEPNTRKFIVMNGDSSSLTYLNGSIVLMPQEMNAYDRISFGDITKNAYMLMPLCSDKFSWTDYMGV